MIEAAPALLHVSPQVRQSVARILGHQHDSGAFIASPDFAQYQYCWLRDGSFTAYALDRAGRHDAARRFHDWCANAINGIGPRISTAIERLTEGLTVQASAMPPARFSLDGSVVDDDWPNFQVDGYGTWLWSLHQHLELSGAATLPHELRGAAEQAARYLSAVGTSPCFDVWEENGGFVHTATLACVYGGLRAAGEMLTDPDPGARADEVRSTVLGQGHRDGVFFKSDHHREVDAALLWLSEPFHLVPPGDGAFAETVERVHAELDLEGGTRRYFSDRYYGGGAWPVLTASLGLYYASAGKAAAAERCLSWVEAHIDEEGHLGEQFGGERRDPVAYKEWVARWGPPATDLLWSHAMYVVLAIELARNDATRTQRGEHDGSTRP
jgi:GH15 family glucan-1,4-alpha-glucosidase